MATYSIWLEYACVPGAAAGAIVYGDYDKPPRKLPYPYILLRGPGVVAMVDVGYNAAAYGGNMAACAPSTSVTSSSPTRISITPATPTPSPMRSFISRSASSRSGVEAGARREISLADGGHRPVRHHAARRSFGRGPARLHQRRPGGCAPGSRPAGGERHPYLGSQLVTIRNDGRRESEDVWVMAGNLVYSFYNITGPDPASPQYTPLGLAQCSQANLNFGHRRYGEALRRRDPARYSRARGGAGAGLPASRHSTRPQDHRTCAGRWASEPRGVRPLSLHL